ncbi:MAG TPA: MmgE/PrpD family protein [Candidatus Dormibacteraeota bacterium]|nr:MmgE/PrpD family protein [Candidatus Dormibacteraeota bacterium]
MTDRRETTVERLAEFVATLRAEALPAAVLEQARRRLLDTMGAMVAGARTAEGRAVRALVADCGAEGQVPAGWLPIRTSMPMAALAGCASARCTEIDDIHLESCTTPGAVVVPTALAVASSRRDVDASSLLAAIVAGYEVVIRWGKAVDGPSILYQGIWPTYLGSGVGACATAARLLGLSTEETAQALATAVMLATGATGRSDAIAARWLAIGCAVQNGVIAAMAARRGFRADVTFLDGRWSEATRIPLRSSTLIAGLGAAYEIERVSVKPYCSAKQAISSVEGFLQILEEESLDVGSIQRVVVGVPAQYVQLIGQPGLPRDRLSSITSVRYQLALAAYDRDGLLDVARTRLHDEDRFRAFMDKVVVEPAEDLQLYYPTAWPARVDVYTPSGRVRRIVRHTRGDETAPFGWGELEGKFRRLIRGSLDAVSADRLIAACTGLGTGISVQEFLTVAIASDPAR